MLFCLQESSRMMMKKRKTRLHAFFEHFSASGECFPANPKGGADFAPDIVEWP
jgi:hypothetical protein